MAVWIYVKQSVLSTIIPCSVPGFMMRTIGCSELSHIQHADIDRWECGRLCLASLACDLFAYDDSLGMCYLMEGVCHNTANATNLDSYTKSK